MGTIENHEKNGQNHGVFLKKIAKITEESRQNTAETRQQMAVNSLSTRVQSHYSVYHHHNLKGEILIC